jgi:hypothetical protein
MSRNRTIFRNLTRRLIGLCVFVGMCVVVLPFPVSVFSPTKTDTDKDRSQRFPCMNRPCGCRSAEECWKKCCCFTNVQKVAWAKENCVTIPQFVFAAAAKEQSGKAQVESDDSASLTSTLKDKSAPCCCAKKENRKATCSSESAFTRDKSTDQRVLEGSTKSSRQTKWVLAIKAAECQGQNVFWMTLAPAIIPAWPALLAAEPLAGDSVPTVSERLPMMSLLPPCPPPKIG